MQNEILVLVQCNASAVVARASLCALTFARDLGKKNQASLSLVVCGLGDGPVPAELLRMDAQEVLILRGQEGNANTAEALGMTLSNVMTRGGARWLIGAATSLGKDVLPRVAGILDVAYVGDCCGSVDHEGTLGFIRPVYAGNALATTVAKSDRTVLSVRHSEFAPALPNSESLSPQRDVPIDGRCAAASRVSELGFAPITTLRPALDEASVIVAGGRALSNRFFEVLTPLADSLNAAIGATRAACDAGYAPNDFQVGQTGKVVAPNLYVAVGISGAVQHVAGIRSSRVIVAINSDAQAPIFSIADYGLVADLFRAVPELVTAIERRRSSQPG
jgi:electron transfer flavoprotein alpha subunit